MAETLNKAIKVITAYAKANGQDYVQVEQIYESRLRDDEYKGFHFRAYINDFGIFPSSTTIAGLIAQFDDIKNKPKLVNTHPAAPANNYNDILDIDLPF